MNTLRYALRQLAATPSFTGTAVLIVAIGIGASTAMFSTVNALVLRPVALPEADRLAVVHETNVGRNQPIYAVSVPNYVDWRDHAQSWESLAALRWRAMNLTGDGDPELMQVREVTANFFPTLGIPTMLGRHFSTAEDRPGGARVAIISEPFWRRRFGGAADIIGRTLRLDGVSFAIVGVTAPGQPLPGDLAVAVPLAPDAAAADRTMNHDLEIYGRLRPGATIAHADAELKAIATRIWAGYPETERGWSTRVVPLAHAIVGDSVPQALYVLLGAVGLLLLIACANLSNLLLVRALARTHELAIRTALGAGRAELIRQIVTEGLVVTLAGGVLGTLASIWAVDVVRALPLPRAGEISIDVRVLGFALVVTVLAGVLSSLGPALKASQARPLEVLKRRSPRASHRSRLRDSMVVAQLALSLTLLVGATLLGRSLLYLVHVDPGFNAEHALTVSLRPGDNERAADFYERVTARVAALPGVTHAGVVSSLPLTEVDTSNNVYPVGPSVLPAGTSVQASWRLVDAGYFGAMQIPIVRGRAFGGLSPEEAVRSVVLSASFARKLFGPVDPVGRQIDSLRVGGDRLTVIGVVGDVHGQSLGVGPRPTFYWSMRRFIYGPMHLVVRSTGEAADLLPSIRAVVKEVDPAVPVVRVLTLEQLHASSLERERLTLGVLGGFTVVALLLAALGTYGVIAFAVQQRRREIGIRIAVGAQAHDIVGLVLRQALRLVGLGTVIGLVAALATARLLSTMLSGVGTTDPLSYLVAAVVLSLAALIAALLPARGATRVGPMVAE